MPPFRPNPRRRFITDLDEIHGVPRISLARTFFTNAALVGAAMCSAC